jgi:uncharacterized membrane protein
VFKYSLFGKKAEDHFSASEKLQIIEAIRLAELRTSGEVRIFIEKRCRFTNPVDRAAEIFFGLKMEMTRDRNGVLVYLAMKDHRYAIFADEGIYQAMGADYWNEEAGKILNAFRNQHYADGLITVISDIGHIVFGE